MTPASRPIGTHNDAPFVGRDRELGLLRGLVAEGLDGRLSRLRVAGRAGSGRRRLLHELFRRGPDAEWVDLASGGVEPWVGGWARDELPDLLASYPEAPVPSWALHALARLAPEVAAWARVPELSPDDWPEDRAPEILGAAVAAVVAALTACTPVVVHAGLEPGPHEPATRFLAALGQGLRRPGAVLVTASDLPREGDGPGERTLLLGPFHPQETVRLAGRWNADASLGSWLHRVSGGRPVLVHELVRWLEELGAVAIEEDRIVLLNSIGRLPTPLGEAAILSGRLHRLPPAARYLLHRIADHEGRRTVEEERRAWEGRDDDFDEALALLRRRGYLYHASLRRPLALSSVLLRGRTESPSRRQFKRRRPEMREPLEPPRPRPTPLETARLAADRVLAAGEDEPLDPADARRLAREWRRARHRSGPVWHGVLARICLAGASLRERMGRDRTALLWVRWARARLSAEHHPALLRRLGLLGVDLEERAGHLHDAAGLREALLAEAEVAGHAVSAARLRAELAHDLLGLGQGERGAELARRSLEEHLAFGLEEDAETPLAARLLALDRLDRREEARALALRHVERVPEWLAHFLEDEDDGEDDGEAPRAAAAAVAAPIPLFAPRPPAPRAASGTRLRLLGRPRIVDAEGVRPLGRLPEWFGRVLATTLAADLLGRPLPARDLALPLREADEPPHTPDVVVRTFNETLFRGRAAGGGLRLAGELVTWSWAGVACDARDLLRVLESGETRVLDRLTGPLLPGVEGGEIELLRERWSDAVGAAVRRGAEEASAARLLGWLEGAGRLADLRAPIAAALRSRGCPRAAAALPSAPSSGEAGAPPPAASLRG